jgi:hypothetical protein
MKVEVIGKEEMQKFLSYTLTLNNRPFKLTGLSAFEPSQESHLANLTGRQRQALITEYSLGIMMCHEKCLLRKHLDISI